MTRVPEDDSTCTKSCFSGILRRILCTGSLPTHPSNSDSVLESDNVLLEKKNIQVNGQGTPGVVARLMGLESLPDMKWIPKDAISFGSKSVRSADYFPQFDYLLQESQHRRVKTSVSFRETPTFVLRFDERNNEKNASGLKMITSPDEVVGFQHSNNVKRSSTSAGGNIKERAAAKKKENKKNNVEAKRSCLKPNNILPYYNKSNEVYIRSSPRLKKKKRPTKPPNRNSCCQEVSSGMKHARMTENTRPTTHARIESSSDSTASSSESSTRTSEISRKMDLNSNTKKNSTPKPDMVEYPCPSHSYRRSNASDDQEVLTGAKQITKSDGLMKSSKEIDFYMKNFVQVCRLNEQDTKNSHDWRWIRFEDSADICLDFEQHILDMLLQQVVDELCGQSLVSLL